MVGFATVTVTESLPGNVRVYVPAALVSIGRVDSVAAAWSAPAPSSSSVTVEFPGLTETGTLPLGLAQLMF